MFFLNNTKEETFVESKIKSKNLWRCYMISFNQVLYITSLNYIDNIFILSVLHLLKVAWSAKLKTLYNS